MSIYYNSLSQKIYEDIDLKTPAKSKTFLESKFKTENSPNILFSSKTRINSDRELFKNRISFFKNSFEKSLPSKNNFFHKRKMDKIYNQIEFEIFESPKKFNFSTNSNFHYI